MPSDDNENLVTENLCKSEFKIIFGVHLLTATSGCVLIHCLAFVSTYNLPFDCFIVFRPPSEHWLAWIINYIFMTITELFATIFYACYVSMPLLLMNQSCWLLDMIAKTADVMNHELQRDYDSNDNECIANTDECLKKLVERCDKFVEWQAEIQDLLQWNFNLEFNIPTVILCLLIYVLSFVSAGIVTIFFLFFHVYAYCWMDSRVTTRIDSLSFAVSKNFHLMTRRRERLLCQLFTGRKV